MDVVSGVSGVSGGQSAGVSRAVIHASAAPKVKPEPCAPRLSRKAKATKARKAPPRARVPIVGPCLPLTVKAQGSCCIQRKRLPASPSPSHSHRFRPLFTVRCPLSAVLLHRDHLVSLLHPPDLPPRRLAAPGRTIRCIALHLPFAPHHFRTKKTPHSVVPFIVRFGNSWATVPTLRYQHTAYRDPMNRFHHAPRPAYKTTPGRQ